MFYIVFVSIVEYIDGVSSCPKFLICRIYILVEYGQSLLPGSELLTPLKKPFY